MSSYPHTETGGVEGILVFFFCVGAVVEYLIAEAEMVQNVEGVFYVIDIAEFCVQEAIVCFGSGGRGELGGFNRIWETFERELCDASELFIGLLIPLTETIVGSTSVA
jgi:hypothetical protein